MSDNLVLEHLRYIHAEIGALREDMPEVKQRLTAVELGLAVRREIAVMAEAAAHLSARVDRLPDRVERMERRLEIAPAE